MSFDFRTGEFHGLTEEVVQAKYRMRVVDGVPTAVTLTAVLMICVAMYRVVTWCGLGRTTLLIVGRVTVLVNLCVRGGEWAS